MRKGEGLEGMHRLDIREEPFYSSQAIIAALNEEPGIGRTIDELMSYLSDLRVLVIDGRSQDRTVEIAKNSGAEIIFQDGIGKGDAMNQGLANMDSLVDYVIFIDADYTYPAHYLPEMIEIVKRDPSVGMVCGNRINGQVDKKALLDQFHLGNRVLRFAHHLLNGVALSDPLTGLRVVRAEIIRDWAIRSKGFDIEVELNHHVERKGYKIVEVPIKYRPRLGEKKLKIRDGLTILRRILLESIQ
jgi:glycosyltransferase involved in cell wall biosynthesis